MLSKLRALLFGAARTPAPPPDTAVPFEYRQETVVEVLYSGDQQWRVIVTRDLAGRFRVHRQFWDTGDWEVARAAFWALADQMATIADTEESARRLAAEILASVTRPSA